VEITFFTDPLCCWSWSFEKPWRKLIDEYGDGIRYRYVMSGMIRDWNSYHDPMNSVSRPLQMGPVWMHASQITHVPMRYSVWHEDPPASSYPACLAVKTAALQSLEAEDIYLLNIRKALMEKGLNIAKPEILLQVAHETQQQFPEKFNALQFQNDWNKEKGKSGFRADLEKTRFHNIGRFPTLTFQNGNETGIMITGYRPYDVLLQAFQQIQPIVQP